MKQMLKQFIANENGATAIEYSLLSAMIAVPLVMALGTLGVALAQIFSSIGNALIGNPSF